MARGNDPGKDFDDQYNRSRREGQRKAARGEGPWADDKYLSDARKESERYRSGGEGDSGGGGGNGEGCDKKTLLLAGWLSGFGWFLSEVVSRVS